MKKLLGEERDKNLSKNLLVSNNLRTFAFARTRQASQRCSNVRVVLFLYISLAEILVFSNDSYFFVNIENMEENDNVLIIKELWVYWLIALK